MVNDCEHHYYNKHNIHTQLFLLSPLSNQIWGAHNYYYMQCICTQFIVYCINKHNVTTRCDKAQRKERKNYYTHRLRLKSWQMNCSFYFSCNLLKFSDLAFISILISFWKKFYDFSLQIECSNFRMFEYSNFRTLNCKQKKSFSKLINSSVRKSVLEVTKNHSMSFFFLLGYQRERDKLMT